jgi:hypothetical protein
MAITKGAIGVTFILTVKRGGVIAGDISGAESMILFLLKPPNNTQEVSYPLEFVTDGTDSLVSWTTTARNQLDTAGSWIGRGYIKLDGYDGATDPFSFEVVDPKITLPAP